jgi:hypothetical protein
MCSRLLQSWRSELSPICAVVGGVLGQEVIKVRSRAFRSFLLVFCSNSVACEQIVSGKGEPLRNVFLYRGLDGNGTVEVIDPSVATSPVAAKPAAPAPAAMVLD